MTDDRFGKQCPVCGKRITPAFLDRHIGIKHAKGTPAKGRYPK